MMGRPIRLLLLILSLLLFTSSVSAASRASFCKCTCGKNSTIIALDTKHPPSSDSISADDKADPNVDDEPNRTRTCADCNRQFCLEYDLPKLADCRQENKGNEEDIIAQCFQRDSVKDQAVIYTFILVTVGLLIYAAVRPYVERQAEAMQPGSGHYASVPSN